MAALDTLPLDARERALKDGALGRANVVAFGPGRAHEVCGRRRPRQRGRVDAEPDPRRPRRADDKVVAIDREQRRPVPVAGWREQDARLGKGETEVIRLDESGRVGDRACDQTREAFSQVAPGRTTRQARRPDRRVRQKWARSCKGGPNCG